MALGDRPDVDDDDDDDGAAAMMPLLVVMVVVKGEGLPVVAVAAASAELLEVDVEVDPPNVEGDAAGMCGGA